MCFADAHDYRLTDTDGSVQRPPWSQASSVMLWVMENEIGLVV